MVGVAGSESGGTSNSGGDAGSDGGEPNGAAGAADDADVPPCVISTFAQTCGTAACHASNANGALDLISPGVASRLVNQPAQHPGAELGTACPVGDKLIDTTNRSASWLLIKLQGAQGSCGLTMPTIGFLAPTQMSCLVNWIDTVQPNGT